MTAPEPVEDTAAALQAALVALRRQGAQQLDPAAFHYLELVSQRLQTQPDAVRHILLGRLQQALDGYTQRFTQAHQAASDTVAQLSRQHPERTRELRRLLATGDTHAVHRVAQAATQGASSTAVAQLVQLNQHIRVARQPDGTDTHAGAAAVEGTAPTELASVRQFRASWSRHRAVDQVQHAVRRGPENAGPLNSQMLVIQSLALMRTLSPHYLQRFMSQVDALLWLEQAHAKLPATHAQKKTRTPARKSPRKK